MGEPLDLEALRQRHVKRVGCPVASGILAHDAHNDVFALLAEVDQLRARLAGVRMLAELADAGHRWIDAKQLLRALSDD